ncbi:hypothetical protein DERF_004729 [Dermatophagoides farinae]|uniref:Uncharacterized protein n=1 Tax=Dermatophagoides farinae TaxID=6954 RepID=A0A922LAF0_DERFA|nr:hypothetical protein DERF_004729 [Dermatophagoides farinae]
MSRRCTPVTVDSGIDSGKKCSMLTIPVIDNDDVSQLMILAPAGQSTKRVEQRTDHRVSTMVMGHEAKVTAQDCSMRRAQCKQIF